MTLRWKKDEAERGLARVGAGPRGSTLRDGEKRYAHVQASGGDWRGPVKGWFWTCPTDAVGQYMNTCNALAPDEATAKAQAMAFVKSRLKTGNPTVKDSLIVAPSHHALFDGSDAQLLNAAGDAFESVSNSEI